VRNVKIYLPLDFRNVDMFDSIINIFLSGLLGIVLYYVYLYFEKFLGDGKK